jgi:hypothetical protein
MAEMIVDNQRVPVVVAVILAALTAAGLWYFFVFRPADPNAFLAETPIALTKQKETTTPVALGIIDTTPGPVRDDEQLAPTDIEPTANTGPASLFILAALAATTTGLLGLRFVPARPAGGRQTRVL